MTINIADTVHYYTTRTLAKRSGDRLPQPQAIGPLAAIVTRVHNHERVDLYVFAGQHSFPAFDVTTKPTTTVQHYWAPKPTKETP